MRNVKELKVVTAAKAAKDDGFVYMSSVVKSVYNTVYHNVNKIEDIIENGKWIPATTRDFGWHGRVGISSANLPEKCINKTIAIEKYCK